MASTGPRFFGLIYIDRKRNRNPNLMLSRLDPVEVYISCAALAIKSARHYGIDFGLFTNKPADVADGLSKFGLRDVAIVAIEPAREIPKIRKFYSAHFKIDVIRELSTGRYGDVCALTDVDIVFCNPLPSILDEMCQIGFGAYDVSSGPNPLHWDKEVRRDLEVVAGTPLDHPIWYGGEFLCGPADAMKQLADEVDRCWPRYVANAHSFHHVGDETAVSASLNILARRGMQVEDLGKRNVVARWWSWRTKYPQPAFADILDRTLVHLPGDKDFLAKQADRDFCMESFLSDFKTYFKRKSLVKRLLSPVDPWELARID